MTETEVRDGLYKIIRSVLDNPALELSPATTAKDVPGWDSLKQVMIMIGVEEHFGVRLSSREIDNITCVGDFLGVISAKAA
jgi:acyl carrier protein